jgi:hypothetical protein
MATCFSVAENIGPAKGHALRQEVQLVQVSALILTIPV